jgi:hypothetical protein
MLGEPLFRLSEGTRLPSMVVRLEKQDAVLPLRSVAREFAIDPDSADGQMLTKIEMALDFVVALRIGDPLPSEVSDGQASWDPTDPDKRMAASRIRHNLVRCVLARQGQAANLQEVVSGWEEAAVNLALVKTAVAGAADLLGDADAAEVNRRVTILSDEMAYIEAMRRTLTRGIGRLKEKMLAVQASVVPASRRDTVTRVQALARRGLKTITHRFDEVDIRLDGILAMLRDMESAVEWLRRQRDWLFRTNHAWDAMFTDWNSAPRHYDEFMWKAFERSYLFLAPRFMAFEQWSSLHVKLKQTDVKIAVW